MEFDQDIRVNTEKVPHHGSIKIQSSLVMILEVMWVLWITLEFELEPILQLPFRVFHQFLTRETEDKWLLFLIFSIYSSGKCLPNLHSLLIGRKYIKGFASLRHCISIHHHVIYWKIVSHLAQANPWIHIVWKWLWHLKDLHPSPLA